MTLSDFYGNIACSTTLEVQSAYNGKLLCKNYRHDKHGHLSNREVRSVWAEIRTSKGTFGNYAHPVLCVYVDGHEEYVKEHAPKGGG